MNLDRQTKALIVADVKRYGVVSKSELRRRVTSANNNLAQLLDELVAEGKLEVVKRGQWDAWRLNR